MSDKYCPRCNTKYDRQKNFCGKCGVTLIADENNSIQYQSGTPTTATGRGTSLYIGIGAIIILLIAGYFGYSHVMNRKSASVKYVNDNIEMISSQAKNEIEGKLSAFEKKDAIRIMILTIQSLGNNTIEDYAAKTAQDWEMDQKYKGKWVLFLVSKNDRKMRIEVGRGLEGKLSDLAAGRIMDLIVEPRFKNGDFDGGFLLGISALIEASRGNFESASTYSLMEGLTNTETNAASPPIPYEDPGACPFECCTYREWTANEDLPILKDRDKNSSVVFHIRKNEKVIAETGVVIITKPSLGKVKKAVKIGNEMAQVGDVIFILTYKGEGFFKVWYKGKIVNSLEVTDVFSLENHPPQSIWWVKIRNSKGQTGWSNHPELFDNKDGCA